MQIEIKNIVANPFRHIDRYPIKAEKVAALRESLQKTGFWDNVVARVKNGKAEIAYGHHRLAALKAEYGPSHKVDLIIRELDDEAMLQIMARENMEEWGTSASVEQETIRAVVQAYADGKIVLPTPKRTQGLALRYAPTFERAETFDAHRKNPYTVSTVAEFIGWVDPSGHPQQKVRDALTALEFIEGGILKESDFDGLSTAQARAVVEQTRKAKEWRDDRAETSRKEAEQARKDATTAATEAKRQQARKKEQAAKAKERAFKSEARQSATRVGRSVSASLKKGEIGYRQAGDVAGRVDDRKKEQAPPDIADYTKKLIAELSTILSPDKDGKVAKLDRLARFRSDLNQFTSSDLADTLEGISHRALKYAAKFSEASAEQREKLVRGERKLLATRR